MKTRKSPHRCALTNQSFSLTISNKYFLIYSFTFAGRVSNVCGSSRGQPRQSTMQEPHFGKSTFVIKLTSLSEIPGSTNSAY